jgi:RNA polymerase sigma-70 factor (ECF subfamily)
MVSGPKNEAFRTQIEPHRRAITAHCYRMLGSLQDAEEVAQESLLRGWQRLDELRSSDASKAWLYKIATNACLDRLKKRRRRVQSHQVAPQADPERPMGPPVHEYLWIEPAPDSLLEIPADVGLQPDSRASMRESISLAFITALQLLPAKQRAVLLLVDVLGWRPRETAELLKTTEVSVNSLLQRARKSLGAHPAQPQPLAGPGDAEIVRRYIAVWESGDLDAFTAMLAEDAIMSMPPQLEWYRGHAMIRRFLERVKTGQPRQYRFVSLRANGSPAVGVYTRPMHGGAFTAAGITVFVARQGLVSQVTRFVIPQIFPLFGLPDRILDEPANGWPT